MYNLFRDMLIRLVADIVNWISNISTTLIETSLKIENAGLISNNPLTAELVQQIFNYIYISVLVLIVLKFIWKGINVYILWRDGDAEVSPRNMLVGMAIAVAASIAFPLLYNIGVATTVNIANGITNTIDENWPGKPVVVIEDNTARAQELWDRYLEDYATEYPGEGILTVDEWNQFVYAIENGGNAGALGELIPIEYANDPRGVPTLSYIKDKLDTRSIEKLSTSLANLNLAGVIALIIYLILYIAMYIQLLGRGLEMLFLRWGFPIATIGYIDSDGGIMHTYVQLIFRQFFTSILQVVALYLSFYVAMDFELSHILLGLGIISVAFKGPVLLAQIVAPQKQGSGIGQKLHTALMLKQYIGGKH